MIVLLGDDVLLRSKELKKINIKFWGSGWMESYGERSMTFCRRSESALHVPRVNWRVTIS